MYQYHGTTDCRSSQLGILPACQPYRKCFCVAAIGHLEGQRTWEKEKGKERTERGAFGTNMPLLKYKNCGLSRSLARAHII
jgi:hypothetical protein